MTRLAINFGWTLAMTCWLWTASEAQAAPTPRQVLNLNGRWQVAEGAKDQRPAQFDHIIPVPGLLDMAKPAFSEVGKKSARREAFWYRRTFRVNGPVPEAAWLKVHKASYGTRVWLNEHDLGEHLPCFTPGWFNARAALRTDGAEQELIIRVGADRSTLPEGMAKGFDFEKLLYLPGVYDSVELILSGVPRIVNVQTVPDIQRQQVRVVAEIEGGSSAGECTVAGQVVEFKSQRLVGRHSQPTVRLSAGSITKVDFTIPLPDCQMWTPEDPFLYDLRLDTGGDAVRGRFGMRTFAFDPVTQRALLNGKPYYLRGSNITLYRFFEDADRGGLPWDDAWVRCLHGTLKAMHWNSLRYCIGFPPERWYEIADEEGFLIQDEYPIRRYRIPAERAKFKAAQKYVYDGSTNVHDFTQGGTVIFRVLVDGKERFTSGTMNEHSTPQRVTVGLRGAKALRLVVETAGDGSFADLADWADARLIAKSPVLTNAMLQHAPDG